MKIEDAGFRISTLHPFIGASPDAYVTCKCCDSGILEVKCPSCVNNIGVEEASSAKSFFLQKNEQGDLVLKEDHPYYYQVQMQLFVTDKPFCDFVVRTEKDSDDLFVQRILPNLQFFDTEMIRATEFFKRAVLPELLAKLFSSPKAIVQDSSVHDWCYCKERESGKMLDCMSGFCTIKRFHQTCLKLNRVPNKSKWACPSCRKIINKQKRDSKKADMQ